VNRLRVLGAVLSLLVAAHIPAAGQQVTLNLRQPPPNQLSIADLWQETVTYFSATGGAAQPITVWMSGTITRIGGLQRAETIVRATTSTFTLAQGTRLFTSQSITVAAPISVVWVNQKMRDALGANGQFPTGEYEVCVELWVRNPNGQQMLARDCVTQSVALTSPPMLIAPLSESSVELVTPLFTWTPPVPVAPRTRVQYLLKIVEIHGRQSAGSAMQTNPAWLEQPVVVSTTVQYPPSARALKAGQRYAWMVLASAESMPLGNSEVWEFTYAPAKVLTPQITPGAIKAVNRLDVLEELLRSCAEQPRTLAPLPK
jgi:hypothetical protein